MFVFMDPDYVLLWECSISVRVHSRLALPTWSTSWGAVLVSRYIQSCDDDVLETSVLAVNPSTWERNGFCWIKRRSVDWTASWVDWGTWTWVEVEHLTAFGTEANWRCRVFVWRLRIYSGLVKVAANSAKQLLSVNSVITPSLPFIQQWLHRAVGVLETRTDMHLCAAWWSVEWDAGVKSGSQPFVSAVS